mgnify:CR=1 FL=1|jgi:UTP--glucose-1-phosphate uridylyltransferase
MNCTKAIIPVAGYGTRRLPVAKAIEKCMLPLLNRPIIDYVVQDCVRAGITDIYFVVSEGAQLKRFYERDLSLEEYLKQTGKEALVDQIMPPENVRFHYVHQNTDVDPRYGTTVPVWLAAHEAVAPDIDEHILVVMGDQCIYRADGGSEVADLIEQVEQAGTDCGMVAVEVPRELVSNYGIVEQDAQGNFVKIWERPSIEEAPSNLNNASMYLFDKEMFARIEEYMQRPAASGEYEIVDPINSYVADGHTFYVAKARGKYLDCGTVEGWVQANNWLLERRYLK